MAGVGVHARVGSIVGVVRVFVREREISVVCVYVCAYCVRTVCLLCALRE
jgi:hypothetical protein